MTMTVTTINYSDIDQTILRDCFDKSLPYMEGDHPNMVWEEVGITVSHTADEKFEAIRANLEATTSPAILFQLDIDGRIVNYGKVMREQGGTGMVLHLLDLIREDANGSQGWTYVTEYNQKIDAWYKSVSDGNPQSSLWVVEGSSMEASNDDAVTQGCLTYTTQETVTHHGYTYKKLVITIIV